MTDQSGQAASIDKVFPAIYDELRRVASAISWSSGQQTLNPTALINEAYLKLAGSKELASTSTLHFKRIAGRAMRQVLSDAARRKLSIKGGEGAARVTLDDQMQQKTWSVEELLVLDQFLDRLRALSSRQADVVECRFYGGLTVDEIASELGISNATVERDWRMARAWLNSQMYE